MDSEEHICIFEKQIPLERHEEISVSILHKLPSLCKTQYQNSAAEKRTLLITTPTNGIHSNAPNRIIPPSIQQSQQICLDRSVHAHRIHILHPTKKPMSRRHDKSLHRPHMLYFWTIKKNPHRQQHRVQKQTLDRSFQKNRNRTKTHTHLFSTVQWQNRRIPQVPQSHNSKITRNLRGMG